MLTALATILLGFGAEGFVSKQAFNEAATPYARHKYATDGYVDLDGHVRNDGLGCSAYVSVVLHRMKYGNEWKNEYNLSVHQKYGDKIAEHFGLNSKVAIPASQLLDRAMTRELLRQGKLKGGTLYLFNTRNGKAGHVGFVRVKADGQLVQSHYSDLAAYKGLATGDFREWLTASQYREQGVELYAVPEP